MKNSSLLFIAFLFLHLSALAQQVNHLPNNSYQAESEFTLFSSGVDTAWVRHYGSGLLSGEDNATAIAVDNEGNMYVTGYSVGPIGNQDFFTIKYDASGVEQWTARYDGPNNSKDRATAIVVDNAGNVYVTGTVNGHKPRMSDFIPGDYGTVKYNSSGERQWVAIYDGPENESDCANAIAVDISGNIYVTGEINGTRIRWGYSPNGYGTIKYNSSGEEQWISSYNGAENRAKALVIDGSGNVYVTGCSEGSGTGSDYTTIKYNTMGIEQWITHYNGPGNESDIATALAVDYERNVYVTGQSKDSGTEDDYATLKYNADGVEQWVTRYNGPQGNGGGIATALAIDDSGNVYVTGISSGSGTLSDYATIKYNAIGVEQWVTRYNGPQGNGEDIATALAIDDSGNVYVTGSSCGSGTHIDYATIKYNAIGVEQWVSRFNGPSNGFDEANDLIVDSSGNVYVTGSSSGSGTGSDYTTIKYNSSGIEQLVANFNSTGYSSDNATDLTIDVLGNVYVTGYSSLADDIGDFATLKYNSSGEKLWVARHRCYGSLWHNAAITVDNIGNVYIIGNNRNETSDFDYLTVKYNADGEEQWAAIYNGLGNERDEPNALAVDGEGNVYVTGRSNTGSGDDYTTIKYNASGSEQWVALYNGPGNDDDVATDLALDNSGYLYVTGYSDGTNGIRDFATIKYNTSGVEQWVARYNGSENDSDSPSAIAINGDGNVYVTGRSEGAGTRSDYTTIKYDATGIEQWVARYNGPANRDDFATAIALDNSGKLYVTGYSAGPGSSGDRDYATIKYDASGVVQWVERYDLGNDQCIAQDIGVDNSGNIYVTGNIEDDFATIKYNTFGEEQWMTRYNGPLGYTNNSVAALSIDNDDNVYVTGRSSGHWSTYTTIKYIEVPVSVDEDQMSVPDAYGLSQNYPNPFNPATTVRYDIPELSFVTLKVYDVLGNEIVMLVNEEKPAGTYEIEFDGSGLPSGVYFYQLRAGNFIETKKMLMIK